MSNQEKSLEQLLTECTWEVMEGISSGETLRSSIYRVIGLAREWTPPPTPITEENDKMIMSSAFNRCPSDLPHFDRMKWIAKEFKRLQARK